ncbi:MAG: hypothetical protein ABJG78_00065 [Cyclobacteriaceae bacterium]
MLRNSHFIQVLLVLTILSGCQEEKVEIIEPSPQEVITANSTLKELVLRMTLNDGSVDNLIDDSSCISVKLPVTVVVGDKDIVIDSAENLATLEIILEESEDDDLEIVFPITIVLPNYSELLVNNQDELEDLQDICDEGDDDDIECLDFKYKLDLFVFDAQKETAEIITINSDKEMFLFFSNLSDADLVGFEFPLSLVQFDGTEVEVNDNVELEESIEDLIDACDEGDNQNQIEAFLAGGEWVVTFFQDTTNVSIAFNDFILIFNQDETIIVEGEQGENIAGEWKVNFSDDKQSFTLELDFDTDEPPFIWLDAEWNITDYSETHMKMEAESELTDLMKNLTMERL